MSGQDRDPAFSEAAAGPPPVSVVTVSFRDPEGLRRTRESVLAQDYPGPLQHVIIDGGSGPEVVDWLSEQTGDLRWVSESDGGIYDAMNKGIDLAEGDVLWFMNSADTFHAADSIRTAVTRLDQPRRQWGFGRSEWRTPDGRFDSIHGPRRFIRALHALGRQVIPHQATFIGADVLERAGRYQPEVPIAADQVLMMKCARVTAPVVLPDVLCVFDTSGTSTRQTRHEHYVGMRTGRRLGAVTVTGLHWLDDLGSHVLEAIDRVRGRSGAPETGGTR